MLHWIQAGLSLVEMVLAVFCIAYGIWRRNTAFTLLAIGVMVMASIVLALSVGAR